MNNDIAVISTFFNPLKYKNRYENYLKFQDFIYECGLKDHFYVSEVLYKNDEPFINHKNILRFKTEDILWHKERALNLTVKTLPKQYTKVVWVDTDIIWSNINWWKEVIKLLEEYNIIQPFAYCKFLNSHFNLDHTQMSIFHRLFRINNGLPTFHAIHYGGTMAYNRKYFECVELYDKDIIGGGDFISNISILKMPIDENVQAFDPELDSYIEKSGKYLENKYHYLDDSVYHLYHGQLHDRQYIKRYSILKNYIFNDMCEKDDNGLYKFKSTVSQKIKSQFLDYFKTKNEDLIQFIVSLSKSYNIERSSNGNFKWISAENIYELYNLKSIKLKVSRMGNSNTSPYLNVICNGNFKHYSLDLNKDTEIIIPVSDKKEVSKLILLGKGFVPAEIDLNSRDFRQLSYAIKKVEILQQNKTEYENYLLENF